MYAWEEPGIGKFVIFLAIEGVVYLVLVFIHELGWFRNLRYLLQKKRAINVIEDTPANTVSLIQRQ